MRSIIINTIIVLAILSSCNNGNRPLKIDLTNNLIHGLASPIKLNYDTTKVILSDYVTSIDSIIKIDYPRGLMPLNDKITNELILISNEYIAPLTTLQIHTNLTEYTIPVIKSSKKKITYTFSDKSHKYKKVALAGDINAWNPANTILKYNNGVWKTDLYLEPDLYSYQVVLDDKWQLDPNNTKKVSNGMGGYNSQLIIKNTSDKSRKPQLYAHRLSGDTIFIKLKGENIRVLAMFQNHKIGFGLQNDNFRIIIPEIAKKKKRTYIRAWVYSKMEVSNELIIPLDFGKAVTKGDQLTRQDKETNILYYIMVDRFNNVNKDNDSPLNDPEVSPKADYHGGDLLGIIEMINKDYFKNLGVTSLWLSPIVRNPKGKYGLYDKNGIKSKFSAYHGYWPISFTQVDERLGSSQDLHNLVKAAHSKNENVLLDFVANHVHEKHPVYQKNKDKNWATNLYLPDGTLNTEKWDDHRLTTWFDVFLPTLNLENQEVTEMLTDSAVYWLDKYDIDGFRHDATKHIPLNFWRTLTQKVNKESDKTGKNYYQVGETYGTPELINSYIGSGLLDGQFDFNIYDALMQSIVEENVSFSLVKQKLEQSIKYYGAHNLMGYMTGNQDKPRFMSLATGEVALSDDSKYVGWSKKITKKTNTGFKKTAMMHAFIMTLPGIPVIYYGDEIGMTGANDPDNRRDMKFKNLNENESELLKTVSILTHLRRDNPVFLFGDLKFHNVSKELMMFSRQYFDKSAIVLVNNSNKKQNFTIPKEYINEKINIFTTFGNTLNGSKVEIKPFSFEVLMIK